MRGDFSVHSFDKSTNHTHFIGGQSTIFAPSRRTLCFGNYDVSGRACLSDASSLLSFTPHAPSPLKLIDRIRAQKEVMLRFEGGAE